jgi:hypothetical protein
MWPRPSEQLFTNRSQLPSLMPRRVSSMKAPQTPAFVLAASLFFPAGVVAAEGSRQEGVRILERHAYNKDESHSLLINESGAYELTWRGVTPLMPENLQRVRQDACLNILHILHQDAGAPGLSAAIL